MTININIYIYNNKVGGLMLSEFNINGMRIYPKCDFSP